VAVSSDEVLKRQRVKGLLVKGEMDEAERRIFDEQEAAGINDAFKQYINSFCAPLYWWIEGEGAEAIPRVLHNGTAFFLDTGVARFGITCWHVLDQLRRDRKQYPQLTSQLGDSLCLLEELVVSEHEEIDHDTFRIQPGLSAWPESLRMQSLATAANAGRR
jgi:hypothetical protein